MLNITLFRHFSRLFFSKTFSRENSENFFYFMLAFFHSCIIVLLLLHVGVFCMKQGSFTTVIFQQMRWKPTK